MVKVKTWSSVRPREPAPALLPDHSPVDLPEQAASIPKQFILGRPVFDIYVNITIADIVFSDLLCSVDIIWGGFIHHQEVVLIHLHCCRVFLSRTRSGLSFPVWGWDEPLHVSSVARGPVWKVYSGERDHHCWGVWLRTTLFPSGVVKHCAPALGTGITRSLTRHVARLSKLFHLHE